MDTTSFLRSNLEKPFSGAKNIRDLEEIKKYGLALWITKKIVRKKFRRSKILESTYEAILNNVNESINKQQPIHFLLCFGGYKHFWNQSFCEIDWAEFFHISHFLWYIAPITNHYKPGVIIEYESEDIAIPIINNYKEADLEQYSNSFEKLLDVIQVRLPSNIQFKYTRCQDFYSKEILLSKINQILPTKQADFEQLSAEELKNKYIKAIDNIIFEPGLSQEQKVEQAIKSKRLSESFYDADFELRPDFFTSNNKIPCVFSWGLDDLNIDRWLTLASVKSSFVDFWVGRGILEKREDRFVPRILSQHQYFELKNKLSVESVEIMELKEFKNLQNIEVYTGVLNF